MLFWDVDTQADFIYPGGKLYVPGAERIISNLKRLTRWAAQHQVLIVSSACAHHPGDPEFAQYPPHCLVGTSGQQKIAETLLPDPLVLPNRRVDLPQDWRRYRQVILEKQELDVFSNPNTDTLLERLGRGREVTLYGVVSEICVALAARGLLRRGHRVSLVADAIRHLEESKSQDLLDEIVEAGGRLITTGDTIAPPRAA